MQFFSLKRASLFAAALLVCGSASASMIGSVVNLQATSTLTGANACVNSAANSMRTVDDTRELVNGAWTASCEGLYTADIGADFIELAVTEVGQFGETKLHIEFVTGPEITGVSFAGYDNFFETAPANFLPMISFTSNTIDIVWNAGDGTFRFGDDGLALFNVVTGAIGDAEVPEPGSMALFGLALAGLAAARRKSKRA